MHDLKKDETGSNEDGDGNPHGSPERVWGRSSTEAGVLLFKYILLTLQAVLLQLHSKRLYQAQKDFDGSHA